MTQEEFVHASLKLIGIGCAIVGFDIIASTMAVLSAYGFQNLPPRMYPWTFESLSRPVMYFGVAFFLIFRTDWCVKLFWLRKTASH